MGVNIEHFPPLRFCLFSQEMAVVMVTDDHSKREYDWHFILPLLFIIIRENIAIILKNRRGI